MHYYGTRLSENISRREPEGYLLCLNVPVARTGTQEYLPEELGLSPPCHPERSRGISSPLTPCHPERSRGISAPLIPVYRPPEEVFSPETIASFEGMPVTNDHPPDGVDIGNIRALQKGHAHNVRRGAGAESDLLLADLIITDPVLIDGILNGGKREISCGYTYELCEENGTYIQRKIRGNHVAVVDAGRAGSRVSIKDHKPERRTHMNTAPFARRLAVGDSYTFLMKELEKVDENILEPLSGTDWPRDMPVITGGGIIESIASVDVTYASTGGEDDNLFFEAANDIPVIQADMSKSVARTFNFAEYMSFPNMEKLIQCRKAVSL